MKELVLRPSQFNITIPNYPEKGKHLLYNTLSRALVAIDNEGLTLLSALKNTADGDSKAFIHALQSQRFLVPKHWNEGESYLQTLKVNSNKNGGEFHVTLLTNFQKCPLACAYCYQKGTHIAGRLEANLSDKVLDFIKKHCQKLEAEELQIIYYGSEPLSNPGAIFTTAGELRQCCHEQEIRFSFGMVTSGVLLTRKLVEALAPLGFCYAQITIDGNRETHNASCPFRNGQGTYDRIMENLEQYAGLIQSKSTDI